MTQKKSKKKRLKKWTLDVLEKLSEKDFIEVFETAISDRTILSVGPLEFENKIKHGAPGSSVELLLREAERRQIPLSTIAKHFAKKAVTGQSFISDICAPSSWKRYEIHAAAALLTVLRSEKANVDAYEFDARIIGKITKRERQVDLLLIRWRPRHIVVCEFRRYQTSPIAIKDVEAYVTFLNDINVNKGVMFTPCGYQEGATATAKHYGIVLFKFREVGPNELKSLYPEKASLISDDQLYWELVRDDDSSWIFGGTLTQKART